MPAGYSALLSVDHSGDDIASLPRSQVWLAQVCNRNPECGFFNTNGVFSFAVSPSSEYPLNFYGIHTAVMGRCLYKKNPDQLQWTYQAHKDFRYSCIYFSVLSLTSVTGVIDTAGFLNQSVPSENGCLDQSCCKALCDEMLTACWSYSFGYGVDKGCNTGGLCCRLVGHLIQPPTGSSVKLFQSRNSRRCEKIKDRDRNVLSLQANITSFVKHFISTPILPEFQSMFDRTNSSNYIALQG